MQKWEIKETLVPKIYHDSYDEMVKEVEELCNDGWELVAVDDGWMYFKRLKQEDNA